MADKVRLPKEVAEAIEEARERCLSNWGIMKQAESAMVTEHLLVIKRWAFAGEGSTGQLMEALVNGYEIAKSPEEVARERFVAEYRAHNSNAFFYRGRSLDRSESEQERYSSGYATGVIEALKYADIEVEGINA